MSWVALVPRDKVHGRARHPVTLSVSKGGRIVQRAFITVQTDLLPELAWWANKATVSIELGTGDHTGRVRLSKGGDYRIMGQTGKGAGRGKANAPTLQFAMDGLPKGGLVQQPVPWEVTGGALILTLPWSGVAGLAKPDPAASQSITGPHNSGRKQSVPSAPAGEPVPSQPPAKDLSRPLAAAEMAVMRKVISAKNNRMPISALDARETNLLRHLEGRGLAEFTPGSGFGWSITYSGQHRLNAVLAAAP